jgi:hypothetical protein
VAVSARLAGDTRRLRSSKYTSLISASIGTLEDTPYPSEFATAKTLSVSAAARALFP